MTELEKLLRDVEQGGEAENRLIRLFWDQLKISAEHHLSPLVRTHIGPSTAVSKAIDSFIRAGRRGRIPQTEDEFRAVLATMLKHKIVDAVRRARSLKRGIAAERRSLDGENDAVSGEPVDRVMMKDLADASLRYLRPRLNDTEWMVLHFLLQGIKPTEMQPALAAIQASGATSVNAIQIRQIQVIIRKLLLLCGEFGNKHG